MSTPLHGKKLYFHPEAKKKQSHFLLKIEKGESCRFSLRHTGKEQKRGERGTSRRTEAWEKFPALSCEIAAAAQQGPEKKENLPARTHG